MTLNDLIKEVKGILRVNTDSSSFWSDDLIKQVINDSQVRLASMDNWACLQRDFQRQTLAGISQYDYPDTDNAPFSFEDGCINLLSIEGVPYRKTEYDDYIRFINSPEIKNRKDIRLFADFNRKIFVFPTPEASNLKMAAIGIATPKTMVNGTDKTIFDGSDPMFDKTIVQMTVENLAVQDPNRKDIQYYSTSVAQNVQNLKNKTSGTRSNAHKIEPIMKVTNFLNNL